MKPYRTASLGDRPRDGFSCGQPDLDNYFRTAVGQDVRRNLARCVVALDADDRIVGYYTLAAASLPLLDLPEDVARRLPRYPAVPAALLGRLAVELRAQGIGLGSLLVADAIERSRRADLAAHMLVVDAKDEPAASFYQALGFIALPSRPLRLVRRL